MTAAQSRAIAAGDRPARIVSAADQPLLVFARSNAIPKPNDRFPPFQRPLLPALLTLSPGQLGQVLGMLHVT